MNVLVEALVMATTTDHVADWAQELADELNELVEAIRDGGRWRTPRGDEEVLVDYTYSTGNRFVMTATAAGGHNPLRVYWKGEFVGEVHPNHLAKAVRRGRI